MATTIEMCFFHVPGFTKCGTLGMNPKRRYWKTATPSATDVHSNEDSLTNCQGQTCYPYPCMATETMSQASEKKQ